MSNLTGQDLVDRLSDLLLADIRDNLELAFEVTKFEVPSGATVDIGDYFTFDSSTTQYYVYYEKDGSTGNDPAPGGRTGIKVDILEADTSGDVATKTVSAVDTGAVELTSISNSINTITLVSDGHTNITQLSDNNVGLTGIVVTDPKGQFDPNHLSTTAIPDGYDKILSKNIAKKSIVETINKVVLDAKALENTVTSNLNQQFGVIGDFVVNPAKKADLELIEGDLLLAVVKIYKELHGSDLNAPDREGSVFPIKSSDLGIDAGLDMNSTGITELLSGGSTSTNAANISDADLRKSKPYRYTVQPSDVTNKLITLASIAPEADSIDPDSVIMMIAGGVLQFSDLIYDSGAPEKFEYSVGDVTGNFYIRSDAGVVDPSDSNDLTDCSDLLEVGDKLIITFSEK